MLVLSFVSVFSVYVLKHYFVQSRIPIIQYPGLFSFRSSEKTRFTFLQKANGYLPSIVGHTSKRESVFSVKVASCSDILYDSEERGNIKVAET